jgi:hypothetical protein
MAVQALVALVWRIPHGTDLDGAIVLPILTTLVYGFVAADAGAEPVAASIVWERVLERSWAVVVIDFAVSYVTALGLAGSTSSSALDLIAGLSAFGLSVLFVFADASAAVDADLGVLTVIPYGFVRSVQAAWQRPVLPRALAIFSLQLLVAALQIALNALLQHARVPDALFWSEIPLLTLLVPPLSALTVLVYLDARAAPAQAAE